MRHAILIVYFNMLTYILFSYRVIRLTSPYLNTLIVVGAILLYINAGILAIPTSTVKARTIACNVSDFNFNKLLVL